MSQENLPKGYEPANIEQRWRDHWEGNKTFTPNAPFEGDTFSIVIPPPNVTGKLHIGHAFNITLQDLMCRHARQIGKTVLWVPGSDHAGIATQNVVEKRLQQQGVTRHDLGREAFLEKIWQWKEEYGDNIRSQIKAMGASVDWTRERFTMDEGLSSAVRKVFVRLFKEGLIYKGDYIINWCTRCHTALADDEVDHIPHKGHLWEIKYDLEDGSGHLVIATTRPETILGDTAIAVHPDDDRYKHLIGKKVKLPLMGRLLPIIADNYVDMEFGTGALKITPSHDFNDWQIGKKHNLEFIQVMDDEGNINQNGGAFTGLNKNEARIKIIEELKAQGHLIDVKDYDNSIGLCYRCKEIIEPHVSTQWFVSVKPLAEKARAAIPDKTKIFPETWIKTYYNWLDNIRDWCISRQIWWGHRIPAWNCADCGKITVEEKDPTNCAHCNSTAISQEDDVLDTWFSSALWPFSTLGWPDTTEELKAFYPTSVLVTGFDILFFWVARMMMFGIHFMGEIPFNDVYIHALVRDAEGKKMSKSTGNVIDPLEMVEKYGTDALRFTLTAFAAMGRDVKLSEDRIDGYRHFVNKIWNATRFALMNMPEDGAPVEEVDLNNVKGIHNQWILHRLEEIKETSGKAIEEYRFNEVAQDLYKFIWTEFCDWYLELSKPDMQSDAKTKKTAQFVLWTVLRETMLLLHPIMPFVTAEIWTALPACKTLSGNIVENSKDIATELYPVLRSGCIKPASAEHIAIVQGAIVSVRTIRSELNIGPSVKLKASIKPVDAQSANVLEENKNMIVVLARLAELEINLNVIAPKLSAANISCGNEIIVSLDGAIDFEAEKARLDKEIAKIKKEKDMLSGKLANENYVAKAPADIVARDRARVEELMFAEQKLQSTLDKYN